MGYRITKFDSDPIYTLPMIYRLDDRTPTFRGEYFVAQNAAVIGSVVMEPKSSVWFNVTVRGDNDVRADAEVVALQEPSRGLSESN